MSLINVKETESGLLETTVNNTFKNDEQTKITERENNDIELTSSNNLQKFFNYLPLRKISFYLILIGLIISVNNGGLEWFLNSTIGTEWSSPLVNFIREGTKGFIILFLVTLYLDITKETKEVDLPRILSEVNSIKSKISDIERENLQIYEKLDNDYITQLNPNTAVTKILKASYKKDLPFENLASIIIPDRPFYTDAYVTFSFFDNKNDKDLFDVVYEMIFVSNFNEFIIAFVPNTTVQDQIAAFCPLVNETVTYPDPELREIKIKELSKGSHHCRVGITSQSSSTKEENLKFQKLTKKESEKYLQNLPAHNKNEVTILRSFLPKDYKYVFTSFSFTFKKDIHFYYWVSDRPIYTKQLTIDATNFSLDQDQKFSFHPMFANTGSCKNNFRPKFFSAEIDNWLVKGQGIAISW